MIIKYKDDDIYLRCMECSETFKIKSTEIKVVGQKEDAMLLFPACKECGTLSQSLVTRAGKEASLGVHIRRCLVVQAVKRKQFFKLEEFSDSPEASQKILRSFGSGVLKSYRTTKEKVPKGFIQEIQGKTEVNRTID